VDCHYSRSSDAQPIKYKVFMAAGILFSLLIMIGMLHCYHGKRVHHTQSMEQLHTNNDGDPCSLLKRFSWLPNKGKKILRNQHPLLLRLLTELLFGTSILRTVYQGVCFLPPDFVNVMLSIIIIMFVLVIVRTVIYISSLYLMDDNLLVDYMLCNYLCAIQLYLKKKNISTCYLQTNHSRY